MKIGKNIGPDARAWRIFHLLGDQPTHNRRLTPTPSTSQARCGRMRGVRRCKAIVM